jgi:putative transposase
MYLAGILVRRVEDITEALWGTRVSPSTVSNLNKKIYAKIEAWRNRRIEGEHPYLYLDGIVMKRTWAGEVRNVSLLVASAVNSEGFREILGICEGAKEGKSGWSRFCATSSTVASTALKVRMFAFNAAVPPGLDLGVDLLVEVRQLAEA